MVNYISTVNHNKLSAPRPEGANITAIVLTYSVSSNITSTLTSLHQRGASVHYTINTDGFQDQHHLESSKAFAAGKSSWRGKASVNDYAISIMLINNSEDKFPAVQIEQLIKLVKDINVRHETTMEVVGLGEVNANHIAPGRLFPWNTLADADIGVHFEIPSADTIGITCYCPMTPPPSSDRAALKCLYNKESDQKIAAIQSDFKKLGYDIEVTGFYDKATEHVVEVFKARYMQEDTRICISDALEYAQKHLLGEDTSYLTGGCGDLCTDH